MGLTTFWKMISYVVGRPFWTHSENDCHHACTKINYILNIKDNKMNQSLLRFFIWEHGLDAYETREENKYLSLFYWESIKLSNLMMSLGFTCL